VGKCISTPVIISDTSIKSTSSSKQLLPLLKNCYQLYAFLVLYQQFFHQHILYKYNKAFISWHCMQNCSQILIDRLVMTALCWVAITLMTRLSPCEIGLFLHVTNSGNHRLLDKHCNAHPLKAAQMYRMLNCESNKLHNIPK
jgi:hypothetical protein